VARGAVPRPHARSTDPVDGALARLMRDVVLFVKSGYLATPEAYGYGDPIAQLVVLHSSHDDREVPAPTTPSRLLG